MYKRKKKDGFSKKIDKIIEGSNKRKKNSNETSNNSSITSIRSDTLDGPDNNDNSDPIIDDKNNSSIIDDKNNNGSVVKRWLPHSTNIEGTHKYFEVDEINL
jgi:hypothetical protein